MNPRDNRFISLFSVGLRLTVAFLWVLSSALSSTAYAQREASDTLVVDTTTDDNTPAFQVCTTAANDCSLRGAISKANADTTNTYTIQVPAGNYVLTLNGINEDSNATGDLDILCNLTILGAGANLTTVDGNQMDRVVHIQGVVTVEIAAIKITGGMTGSGAYGGSEDGGGIYIQGSLFTDDPIVTLTDMAIVNNATGSNYPDRGAGDGGGINIDFGALTLTNSTVSNNTAGFGAAGEYGGSGGGIYNWRGQLAITDSTISDNMAGDGGSGSNDGGDGGGLYNYSDFPVTIAASTISGNTTGDGGSGGSSSGGYGGGGGGIYNDGFLTVTHSAIISNTTGYGGLGSPMGLFGQGAGIYNIETLNIENSSVSGNTSVGHAGGIYNSSGELAVSHSIISDNVAQFDGGGLYLSHSTAVVEGNTIQNNRAVTGNAMHGGGGFYISQQSAVTLTNNIITDNRICNGACLYVYGPGIYLEYSTLQMTHGTVARNSGGDGAGIHATYSYVYPDGRLYSTAIVTNTIIVSQSIGIRVEKSFATLNAMLWGSAEWANGSNWSGSGAVTPGTIHIMGDPGFVAPDSSDYHIGLASAARDEGVATDVRTDIDGESRSFGSKPDLGADELALTLSVTKVGPGAALPGELITYTLTVTNRGVFPATDVVITDSLPVGSQYGSGGTLLPGDVVSWAIPSLAAGSSVQVQFAVSATQTITNADYRVSCAEGVSAAGDQAVITSVSHKIYLPLTLH